MRKVLAVITAILLAAIVFAPAMGYTISSGPKVNYSINSEKVSISAASGTPAHENVYSEGMGEHQVTYSISSQAQPYSFKLGTNAGYSFKAGTTELNVPTEAKNATELAAKPPAPVVEAVPVTNVAEVTNNTVVVSPAPTVKLAIAGNVTDTNKTGLAGWEVNLEMPAGTVFANATTSKNGSYSFGGLAPGAYVVAEVLKAGWTPVAPADGKESVELIDKDKIVDFANKMEIAKPQGNATLPKGNQTNTT